jgi:hypothetical protein
MVRRPSYVAVPGSDRLQTRKRGASAATPVEQAAPSSLKRVEVEVDGTRVVVGPALLQGPQVPLLLEVTDRLGPLLSPESFVVYLHLYRLAVAEGKNACRLGLAELARRTGLQGRRLNKAIADAVAARAIVLVDRTRDGTLYRVRLPGEILDEGPTVLPTVLPTTATATATTTTATSSRTTRPTPTVPPTATTVLPTPALGSTTTPMAPRSVGDVCRWFEATWGSGPGRSGPDVATAVMALLEDGETFATIPALLTAFVQKAPRSAPLRDLTRYRD